MTESKASNSKYMQIDIVKTKQLSSSELDLKHLKFDNYHKISKAISTKN